MTRDLRLETDEELGDNASVRSNSPPKDYPGGGYDGVEGEVGDSRDPFLLFLQCRGYAPRPLSNPNDYYQAVQQAHLDSESTSRDISVSKGRCILCHRHRLLK